MSTLLALAMSCPPENNHVHLFLSQWNAASKHPLYSMHFGPIDFPPIGSSHSELDFEALFKLLVRWISCDDGQALLMYLLMHNIHFSRYLFSRTDDIEPLVGGFAISPNVELNRLFNLIAASDVGNPGGKRIHGGRERASSPEHSPLAERRCRVLAPDLQCGTLRANTGHSTHDPRN